jgi:hypothetical protein
MQMKNLCECHLYEYISHINVVALLFSINLAWSHINICKVKHIKKITPSFRQILKYAWSGCLD